MKVEIEVVSFTDTALEAAAVLADAKDVELAASIRALKGSSFGTFYLTTTVGGGGSAGATQGTAGASGGSTVTPDPDAET